MSSDADLSFSIDQRRQRHLAYWLTWHWGVSTQALEVRLRALRITVHEGVRAALADRTQPLLRRHWQMPPGPDPITLRMRRAAERRFPTDLITRLEAAVVEGRAPAGSLAFALDIPEGDLELGLSPIADPARDAQLLECLV